MQTDTQHMISRRLQLPLGTISVRNLHDELFILISSEGWRRLQRTRKFPLRALSRLEAKIQAEERIPVHVIVGQDEKHLDVEKGIKALANSIAPGLAEDVVVSPLGHETSVWLIPSSQVNSIQSEHTEACRTTIDMYLRATGSALSELHFVGCEGPAPTLQLILRVLKEKQPLKIDRLAELLKKRGFSILGEDWLNHQVDSLRKRGLVCRTKAGEYLATQAGLSLLPMQRGRTSSDVLRALELGRKKW